MTTLLPPRAAYDLWAETYAASAHNPLMRVEQDVVERILRSIRPESALDVGTGRGRYLPILAAAGASRIAGVDLSLAMLKRAEGPRICADACRLPFRRATFDVVNASLMVGDLASLCRWTAEMARVLVIGGHLVYSDFHPTWSANGWQRTFRDAAGAVRVVAFEPHPIEDHLAALDAAGLTVRAIREPRLRIGRRDEPVLAIFHAVKERPLTR